jgi:hypothetical protein
MALLTAAEEAVDGVLEAAHNVADGTALAAASTAPALREGNIGSSNTGGGGSSIQPPGGGGGGGGSPSAQPTDEGGGGSKPEQPYCNDTPLQGTPLCTPSPGEGGEDGGQDPKG